MTDLTHLSSPLRSWMLRLVPFEIVQQEWRRRYLQTHCGSCLHELDAQEIAENEEWEARPDFEDLSVDYGIVDRWCSKCNAEVNVATMEFVWGDPDAYVKPQMLDMILHHNSPKEA